MAGSPVWWANWSNFLSHPRAACDRTAQGRVPLSKSARLLGVSLSSLQSDEQEEPQLGLPI